VNGISQNIETINFIKSKITSKNVIRGVLKVHYRYCSLKLFYMVLINGEKVKRNYLVYSESTGSVFCAPCKLFGSTSVFSTVGFSNWKHAEKRITSHENSQAHKTNVLTMKDRGKVAQRIDSALILQIEGENNYWKNVLRRVVAVVKTLFSRGLAFRGKTDKFGCNQNGNFLMSLELIALFDPFLATHIEKFGNKGKGFTSYLSFNIFEQFITVMADQVLTVIVEEIQKAKYFSIIVDSTPDISHVDQLSFVVRYVKNDGTPIERFMCFLPNSGHKSEELTDEVLTMLSLFDLDPAFLRAQSYDNANNMAGAYSGLQARIKEINPLANFVPCAARSLNLVGTCAASACREASDFFDIVQNIYNFFTASTHRWSELEGTVKSLSATRWSARDDHAYHSLSNNWNNIVDALHKISNNINEKPSTKSEAVGLLKKINRLETVFMTIFWTNILERVNKTSKKLQSVDIDLITVVELYQSLIHYIESLRNENSFKILEDIAIKKSGIKDYNDHNKRKRKRKMHIDENNDNEVLFSKRNYLIINTYYVILDKLSYELKRRKLAYDELVKKFLFFFKLHEITPEKVREDAEVLQKTYPNDLAASFVNECVQFQGHIKNIEVKFSTIQMLQFIRKHDITSVYPYVEVALRILLCTPSTNCSAERSFSTLKRIKNYLRSTMAQDRCSSLAVLAIEAEITNSLDFEKIINDFATFEARKKKF